MAPTDTARKAPIRITINLKISKTIFDGAAANINETTEKTVIKRSVVLANESSEKAPVKRKKQNSINDRRKCRKFENVAAEYPSPPHSPVGHHSWIGHASSESYDSSSRDSSYDTPPATYHDTSRDTPYKPHDGSNDASNDTSPDRPIRKSKEKFYKLLSSVVKKKSQEDSSSETETVSPTKDKISLSKSEKKAIARLLHCRRHFPAEISVVEGKGTGVKTLRDIASCQFVCEYAGELISKTEALRREKVYAARSATTRMSCYMYYFEHGGLEMCVDATSDEGAYGIGRLINHSVGGNLATVKIMVDGIPRLALVAKRDISYGEELSYDYGDRGTTSIAAYPWLSK